MRRIIKRKNFFRELIDMADKKIFGNVRVKDNERMSDDDLDKVIGGATLLTPDGKPIINDPRRNEILETIKIFS